MVALLLATMLLFLFFLFLFSCLLIWRYCACCTLEIDSAGLSFTVRRTKYTIADIDCFLVCDSHETSGGSNHWWRSYIIRMLDGKTFEVNGFSLGALMQAERLEHLFVQLRYPLCVAALESGESLCFGRVLLTRSSVSINTDGLDLFFSTYQIRHNHLALIQG